MKQISTAIVMLVVISAACLGSTPSASAVTLFGAEAADGGDNLYTIDPATAAGTLIGDTNRGITGLAVHPATGVLYGSTAIISPEAGSLVTINPTTGATTLVGSFGLVGTFGVSTLADLSFDPLTGILYGWRSASSGDLYTVDLTTGAATLVGDSGLALSGGMGLAFNESGTLYFAGNGTGGPLRIIDKTTGLTVVSVTMSGYETLENINSLAFDGSTLYGVTAESHDLITIDVSMGIITTIGVAAGSDGGSNPTIDAIAFTPRAEVPEPATLALMLAGLAVVGLLCRRGA